MDILSQIRDRAKALGRSVVFPEGEDDRTLQAVAELQNNDIIHSIVLGDVQIMESRARELELDLDNAELLDPKMAAYKGELADILYERRKHKGMTLDQARQLAVDPLYFGALMVKTGRAQGSVAGAAHSTGDVIRAALYCIGLAEGIKVVSSSFMMVMPTGKVYMYSDGAVVPNPDAVQLASIAVSAAHIHQALTGEEPVVGMLSYSTKGSAEGPSIDKVRQATAMAKELRPDLRLDGELQVDAAIVPKVAESKAPGSPVKGEANVFIFPDLDAGNIAYKITQRLAGAQAIGPIVQGLEKPAFDLSRGCNASDIVNVAAINALISASLEGVTV
ncbi:phosphate acetyltransferase [candidate division LCP-89 bacterium B3_LCP]|uniref:Phosphate acetyltransferase n=1 Tax=candidate division LCP-89 bacterium B3_LCP TaxID=2012998 RepID=A0A532UVU6_UNCL8|nr:MAG: phosphate acetyltransferase [candidate division LCP-89 bacterium B3_LCP]